MNAPLPDAAPHRGVARPCARGRAGQGDGRSLVRITRMCLRHPWQVAIAIVSTFVAADLQLFIPRLLGQAVDQAQGVIGAGAGAAAEQALWTTALTAARVSVLRGLFTMVQNYYGESVGHQIGYELRLAFYEKIQRLSFSLSTTGSTPATSSRSACSISTACACSSPPAWCASVLLGVLIGVGAYLLISDRPGARAARPELRAVRRLALLGHPAGAARAPGSTLQERLSVLSRVMDENLGGIRVVRAFAAQRHELDKFDRASRKRARSRQRARRHPRRATPAP